MKINFDQPITNLDGKPIKEQVANDDGGRAPDRNLTLGRVCVNSLLMLTEAKLDGKEKVERFELAKKIHAGGEINLETEEIAKIKKLVAEAYATLVVGQAFSLLEKKSVDAK